MSDPILVVCAIILCDKRVLVTQRSTKMTLPLKWEFPGGKVMVDETEEESLHRELKEELSIEIQIVGKLNSNVHNYGTFEIKLMPFIAKQVGGELTLTEHANAKWFSKEELFALDWAAADIPILNELFKTNLL